MKYVGKGGLVQELERNLKLQDSVLKFQTVVLAEDVNASAVTVDPEEVKYTRIEAAEDEKEESRERQLGLVDFGEGAPRSMREPRGEDEFVDEEEAPESTIARAEDKVEVKAEAKDGEKEG